MDESNFEGVPASSDTGGGVSSTPADSSVSAPSESSASSQVDPFVQFAQDARAANIADTSNAVAETPAVPEVQAESQNEGDSETPEGVEIPETDDDLKGLTDDNSKRHIQELRQYARQNLVPKAKQFDAQQAIYEKYGVSPEFVEPSAKLFSGLLATTQVPVQTENGVVMQSYMSTEPFWNELAQTSEDHLYTALYDAARMFPNELLQNIPKEQLFQAIGLNPALAEVYSQVREDGTLNGLAPATSVNQETLNSLPEELRATYAEIAKADPEYANEIEMTLANTPRVAQQMLRTEKFQQEADAKDRAAKEQQQQQAVQQREQAAQQRVSDFYDMEGRAFMDELGKTYKPFGTGKEAEADNARIQERISRAVERGLAADPTANRLLRGIEEAIKNGNNLAKIALRTQLTPHITRLRNEEIAWEDKRFRVTIGNEQQQREASAKLKSVNGMGGFSADRPGNGLANPEDLNDPANFLAMARQLGVQIGQ